MLEEPHYNHKVDNWAVGTIPPAVLDVPRLIHVVVR